MVKKEVFSKGQAEESDASKTIDLKALSRKTAPTGRELGILEIERMCEIHKANVFEGYKPKSVIPDINRFMEKLGRLDPRGEAEYNRYIELHHWILEEYNGAAYDMAAAERGLADLQAIWTQKIAAEETLQFHTGLNSTVEGLLNGCLKHIMGGAVRVKEGYKLPAAEGRKILDAMPEICRTSTPLDELFDENGEWTPEALELEGDLMTTRDMIVGRIFHIKGFNYTLERIGALLDVPDIVVYKVPFDVLTARVKNYNESIDTLKKVVKKGYEPDRARKLDAVRRLAKPITPRAVGELSENAKAQIEELIKSWRGIYGAPPLSELFSKPRRGGGNRKGTGKGSAEE